MKIQEQLLKDLKGVMQLETIASVMKDTSLCGLGQTAPNPFISALKNFRDEFEEHILTGSAGPISAKVSEHFRLMWINVQDVQRALRNVL